MTLKQLLFFRTAAEEKSILRAAQRLNMAQPPVSRQIELLEEELGTKLLYRTNRGVGLTEAGEAFYRSLGTVFDALNALRESVQTEDETVSGTVRIGVLYSVVSYALKKIEKYHAAYPAVKLYVRLGTPDELQQLLRQGELDVVFLRSLSDKDTQGLPLGTDPLELIMVPATDPAPGLAAVPVKKLHKCPLCLLRMNDLTGYNEYLLSECRKNGVEPDIVSECYDTPMAMQMVQAGLGLSFLPRSILSTHPYSGIYAKPVEGVSVLSRPMLIKSTQPYLPRAVRLFMEVSGG